jgi:MoxR-like ATPase
LADEINRAPAKVQSALLEAMQERQITIGDKTYKLPEPFLVMATQNPIEQEGTYPLPEAQVDRFMLKVVLPYPNREEEKLIVRANVSSEGFPTPNKVVDPKQIIKARDIVKKIYMDEKIEKYIVDIVYATREPEHYQVRRNQTFYFFWRFSKSKYFFSKCCKSICFFEKKRLCNPRRC